MNIHVLGPGQKDCKKNKISEIKTRFMMLQCGIANMTPKSFCLQIYGASESSGFIEFKIN